MDKKSETTYENHHTQLRITHSSADEHTVTESQIRAVTLLIFVIFIGLFSVYSLSFQVTSNIAVFRSLQLSAALLAGLAAIMSLIKYYTRGDNKYLYIGVGFLGAAILKGMQAVPETFPIFMENERLALIASSDGWGFSRFFLGTLLAASLIPWFLKWHITHKPLPAYFPTTLLLSALAIVITVFAVIPISNVAFLETLAATTLTFVLGGYLLKGLWKKKYFEYCLVLGLLIAIIAGVVQISPRNQSEDHLILSQLLEAISYTFVVVGLLISMYIAYKEVEEAKENTDAILGSIGDGVFVVDNQGTIVLMNQVAEQLVGIPATKAIGKYYHEVFNFSYEENRTKQFPPIVEKILSRQEYKEDNTNHPVIHNRQGTTPILLTASPVKARGGRIIGCVVVMVDMSKMRELERSKDNFLSLAAHQLGTPLGAVRWYMQMLMSGDAGKISKEVKDILKQVEENNQRMVDLVNKLLDVSRIDQKSVSENPKDVQLEKLVSDAINNLKIHAFKRQVTISFTPPSTPSTSLHIDPDLLREVITNIISNGIKYNKQNGSVTIDLKETKEFLELTIKDTGIGIPETDQDKIYSKFFRASNARTTVPDGTGLGLFVAKSYLESWGGKIDFASKVGEGTTLTLSIPKKPTLYTLSAHLTSPTPPTEIKKNKKA